MPAGLLIKTLRAARTQWLTSRASLRRQTEEFLGTEQKTLVTGTVFGESESRIAALNRQIDRLDARIKRLEAPHG